jgi:hypothetical protein
MNALKERLHQRWQQLPLSVQWILVLLSLVIIFIGPAYFKYFTKQGGAALYAHNHTDRPLYMYWVNDNWGGNGGVTCCWSIRGDQLRVVWIKSMTGAQYRKGFKDERHELLIPNPPRQRKDDTLHVHFLPGDQVRLAWSDLYTSPLKDEIKAPLYRYIEPQSTKENP